MDPQSVERLSTRHTEPYTIRLTGNRTTGFEWQAIYDPQAVELVDRSYQPASSGVGAGGEDTLTFKALQPGTVSITMELRRPWEKGPRESRVYQVRVEP
jgi:inhibitor of cysteine peptidase